MRLAFFIICMAAIGVAVVHIQAQENLLRHKMLTMQCRSAHEVTQRSGEQQKELAFQMAPLVVRDRAVAMHLPMVDKRDQNTGIARNTGEGNDSARRPHPPVPAHLDGRPHFGGGHD
jgi:hypothetical protein